MQPVGDEVRARPAALTPRAGDYAIRILSARPASSKEGFARSCRTQLNTSVLRLKFV
jgi:hypothetical protein